MSRTSRSETVTVVEVRCEPLGRARENGPHLADLRRFVSECDGLPDEARVSVDMGTLSESGRRTVRISLRHTEAIGDLVEPQDAAEAAP